MRTIEKQLFTFDELSDRAKENALDGSRDWNVEGDWWDGVYMDAGNVGLRVTHFDLGRRWECGLEWIEGPEYTAHKIMSDHGHECPTFKDAESYLSDRDDIIAKAPRDENGELEDEYALDDELDKLDAEFLHTLAQDYLSILQSEYEYLTSDEAVAESLQANGMEFDIDGNPA